MILKMTPIIENLLMDFIRIQTEEFSAKELQEGFAPLDIHLSINEIEAYLEASPFIFALEGGKFLTRAGAFMGATFIIKPTRKEIEGGYLLVGHRCIPFVNSEVASGVLQFSFDNEILPRNVMEFPLREVLPFFSLFGEEGLNWVIDSAPMEAGRHPWTVFQIPAPGTFASLFCNSAQKIGNVSWSLEVSQKSSGKAAVEP